MTTSYNPDPQAIVAFDVGLGFANQGKCLWCVDIGTVSCLAVYQTMQQVQHMRFGCHAGIQGQFHSTKDDLFVVMKNESKDHRRAGEVSGPAVVERPVAIP